MTETRHPANSECIIAQAKKSQNTLGLCQFLSNSSVVKPVAKTAYKGFVFSHLPYCFLENDTNSARHIDPVLATEIAK